MRNKYAANHVLLRDGVFYYVRSVPLYLADSAKVTPVSLPPENVDVDWIISETEKHGSWTDRNPLWLDLP